MACRLLRRRGELIWISVLMVMFSVSCTTSKESVLPQDGKTMQQIYDEHFGTVGGNSDTAARALLAVQPGTGLVRPLAPAEVNLSGYTRDAYNEIEAIFPQLPNPTLVMYVFPHLSTTEGVPVPGYSTTFSMYERVEYALPGEVPNRDERRF